MRDWYGFPTPVHFQRYDDMLKPVIDLGKGRVKLWLRLRVGCPTSVPRPNASKVPRHSLTFRLFLRRRFPGRRVCPISDPLICLCEPLLNRRAPTPDPVTVWMAVAGSGVTQPEAALESRELLAGCRCRRLLASRMRARQRDRGRSHPRRRIRRRPPRRSTPTSRGCRVSSGGGVEGWEVGARLCGSTAAGARLDPGGGELVAVELGEVVGCHQ